MTVFEKHVLRIARDTMRMHCAGARIMGGQTHREAVDRIADVTGKRPSLPTDCSCPPSR